MTNKEKVGLRIKARRMSRNLSQQALADLIGCSQSAIGMYESGKREPDADTLEALADVFNVPKYTFLMDEDEVVASRPLPSNLRPISEIKPHRVPLIGSIAAGVPILAEQEYEVYVDAPSKADYALTVQGDSMEPIYLTGDVVYIRAQPDVDDGQIGVVLIDDSATLKRVYHISGGLQLISENPKYAPMVILGEDHECLRILGSVVGYTRMYYSAESKLNGVSKGMHHK